MTADRLLTASDVADQLQVSRTTVYRLAKEGAIGCVRLRRPGTTDTGVTLRFTAEQVADYIDAASTPPAQPQPVAPRQPRRLTDLQRRYPHLQPPSHRSAAS